MRVLFFVEGYTDIRFVVGLSQICDLTMVVPQTAYQESGLKGRVIQSEIALEVVEIPGSRLGFQWRSLCWLWRYAQEYDVILAQEVLRGALNANLVGRLRQVPVVMMTAIAPVEYFRCRRERKQLGWMQAIAGEWVIRSLVWLNGKLATRCLAMGSYLTQLNSRDCRETYNSLYYGIDVEYFSPPRLLEREHLRRHHHLPSDRFVILFPSRISHEKDPETVLKAVAIARSRGLNAVILNLSGGYQTFLDLAKEMNLPDWETWVLARSAVHPMTEMADFLKLADVVVQASLAEGLGIAPLEAIACGTPVVATAVGGMAVTLPNYARLVPRRDAEAMAEQLLWVANHPKPAQLQALRGRNYVVREWNHQKAFGELQNHLKAVRLVGIS